METGKLGKRGTVVPARLRRRFGIEQHERESPTVEETGRRFSAMM